MVLRRRGLYCRPVVVVNSGAGAWLARKGIRGRRGGALARATIYVPAMLDQPGPLAATVEDAWDARNGQPAERTDGGTGAITPFRKTFIVDAGDRYVEGTSPGYRNA